ncbi:MAG: GNAT family N-acetyltransferase [Pseudomonadota bacterium]
MSPDDLADIHRRAMTVTAAWGAPTIKGFLAAPGAVLVTREEAFALGRVMADEAELLTLVVAPDRQRRGMGRACLRDFEGQVRAKGARRVFLEVADSNEAAVALYHAEGFRRDGVRHGYYETAQGPLDAVLMSKVLVSD